MELWELVRLVSERYGRRLEVHKQTLPHTRELQRLTVHQLQYLQALRRSATPTVGYLSAYFGVRSPTATVAVARLEEKGYLTRTPAPHDRRSQHLVLTAKARRLLAVQERAFMALAGDIASSLSASELKAYTSLTAKVCRAFEALDDTTTHGTHEQTGMAGHRRDAGERPRVRPGPEDDGAGPDPSRDPRR